jgi:hypothetical protein
LPQDEKIEKQVGRIGMDESMGQDTVPLLVVDYDTGLEHQLLFSAWIFEAPPRQCTGNDENKRKDATHGVNCCDLQ